MPDKIVSYVFRGQFASLTAGLGAAGRGVQDLGKKLTALDRDGARMRQGLNQLGGSAGRFGLVAAAGFGAAVAAAANFDQAMSNVSAATHETAGNMALLRQAALDAGQATQYSASEAAGAIENLAKAGVSTADILSGGLSGALNLAASDGIAVADAAEIAASALTQFNLAGTQTEHVADLLSAGAGKAQGGVAELGQALNQSGLVAAQTGLSIEETVGALAEFANAGLIGSDAGTSFKTMLQALTPNSKAARDAMENLNIQAYDAQGNFIGMTAFADKLQKGLSTLSVEQQNAALKTIFGSDAVRAASIIFKDGAAGVAEWQGKVDDAGYAAETAAIRMDNLKGDLEQLRGAFETALIGSGDGAQGPFRGLVQGATDAVNVFNGLPAPIQGTATSLAAITAVTGGALWFGSKVIQGVVDTRQALSDLGPSGAKARGGLALATKAVAGLTAGFIAFEAAENAFDLSVTAREIQRMTALLDAKAGPNLADQIEATQDAIAKYKAEAGNGVSVDLGFTKLFSSDSAAKAQDRVDGLTEHLADLTNQQEIQEAQAESGAGANETYAGAVAETGDAAEGSAADLATLTEAMQKQREAALSAFDAETQYRQALKDAREQGDKSNAGIRGDSEEALKNRDIISGLAAAWNDQSDAVKNNEEKFKDARKAFIETATAMGIPIEQARRLARNLLEIPESTSTKVTVQSGQAEAAVSNLRGLLGGLKDKTVHVNVVGDKSGLYNPGAGGLNNDGTQDHDGNPKTGKGRADGGPIYGPGTATSDSIPAMLSNGEYVIRAAAVAKYGAGFFDQANRMKLAGGGTPGRLRGDVTAIRNYLTDDLDLTWPKTLKAWEKALDKSKDTLEKERSARDAIVSKMGSTSEAIRGNLRSDLFGKQKSTNVWMSDVDRKKAGAGSVRSTLLSDIANAQATKVAIAQLKSKGLDGAALDELLSKGSLNEIQGYAGQTRAELADYKKLFNTRAVLSAQAGTAGANAAYGRELALQTAEVRRVAAFTLQLNRQVGALTKELKSQPGKNGKAFGDAINHAGPRKRP